MKKRRYLLLILVGGFCVFLHLPARADFSKGSKDAVEVIIQGKQYKSIHAYKREQIKKTLKQALSSYDLTEFEENELEEIMREIRRQQPSRAPSGKESKTAGRSSAQRLLDHQITIEEDEQDRTAAQMQEMLDQYSREHKGAADVELDPDKVKSIIIKP